MATKTKRTPFTDDQINTFCAVFRALTPIMDVKEQHAMATLLNVVFRDSDSSFDLVALNEILFQENISIDDGIRLHDTIDKLVIQCHQVDQIIALGGSV